MTAKAILQSPAESAEYVLRCRGMARLEVIVQAEGDVFGGEFGESQDSQAILNAFQAEFGAGTRSGKLVPDEAARSRLPPTRLPPVDRDGTDGSPAASRKQAPRNEHSAADSGPRLGHILAPNAALNHQRTYRGASTDDGPRRLLASLGYRPSLKGHPPGRGAKMDVSQQTPTQLNEGRDYTTLYGLPSSSADETEAVTQPMTNDEPHTLHPDETGAVNFSINHDPARPSSQVSEDGGFENTRGNWRQPDASLVPLHAAADTPHRAQELAPETPALPKNPFGNGSNGAVPLGGTQLFGQTQTLSSAAKHASPTSSRPSPNLLNSISTNIVETSPLKNRANVSSPTEIRTSSPTRLHEIPATVPRGRSMPVDAEETPRPHQFLKDDLIPESPADQTPRPSVGPKPLAHYVPMKQSQERKMSDGSHLSASEGLMDDFEDDAVQRLDRRKRAERKRQLAAEEMGRVSFVRSQTGVSDEQVVNKRRRLHQPVEANGNTEDDVRRGRPPLLVQDSAEPPSVQSTKATPGDAAEEEAHPSQESTQDVHSELEAAVIDEEMIPATSPIRSFAAVNQADAPASEPELPPLMDKESQQAQNGTESSSLPRVRRPRQRTYGKARGTRKTTMRLPLTDTEEPALPAAEAKSDKDTQSLAAINPDDNTRSSASPHPPSTDSPSEQGANAKPQISRRSRILRSSLISSSSLTNLSGTPAPSSNTTPTKGDYDATAHGGRSVGQPSPDGVPRAKRVCTHSSDRSESPQSMLRARPSRRSLRNEDDSAERVDRTPSIITLDKSACSKWSRCSRTSLGPTTRTRRLFEGMVFALTFSENQTQRTKLEARIMQAGGTILHEGFQELFEPLDVMQSPQPVPAQSTTSLTLTRAYADCGFAALIADGHSRKAKYMQALALGLPCLAPQWATCCLKRGELVDWSPYLLCAGASAVLGNAVRSRVLAPYPAAEARLAETLHRRDKLLAGEKLLMIVEQQQQQQQQHHRRNREAKQQYLFLALALGPAVVARVSTAQQAAEATREAKKRGAPFGWIYADETLPGVLALEGTMGHATDRSKSKSRSKNRTGVNRTGRGKAAAAAPAGVLTDERVIQSLILGRMMGSDEPD
ncbi:brct domain containing protein [Moelleriella libera RCEF 2490]|uniref:Brct domain containing protein n=1 Tax=Moelleriella libera RCEF 2490 TaxID=1081109 RepID=A0A167ZPY2_9HYPO|nr:brct domain containing protein [Moelleriella libera RCEF 2490]